MTSPTPEVSPELDGAEQHPDRPQSCPKLLNFSSNDDGNARRLIAMSGRDLLYCHDIRKWLVWDGRRWAPDRTQAAKRLAKLAMIEFYKQASSDKDAEKFARNSLNNRAINNLLEMAQPSLPVLPEQLDVDPYLLNCSNGVVNLRTGRLLKHDRKLRITKLVPHDFIPTSECPKFLAFLREILGESDELVEYFQKALGYSITALTSEKVVFVLHGSGNNGKSTLLTLFLRVLGDYAALIQIDSLMTGRDSNNTSADLADLRGARFVMTSEAEADQRLSQGKLKRLTQGMGKIKATRKYENPVSFPETHKLWMDTNRRPTVPDPDDRATWNRLVPIPFVVTIPPERIDRELGEKLIAEAEGILAWAVRGAVRWAKEGLGRPAGVERAIEEWRDESDSLGNFLGECLREPGTRTPARQLYTAYKDWCTEVGEQPMTETTFGRKLSDRGFRKQRTETGMVYLGVALPKLLGAPAAAAGPELVRLDRVA
jgi:putative DNA primase/helicase